MNGGNDNFNILIYAGSDVDVGLESFTNDHNSVVKDAIATSMIPSTISECSLATRKLGRSDVCSTDATVKLIKDKLGISGDINTVIEKAKSTTSCKTEKCAVSKLLGNKHLDVFKIEGPTDTKLLNNVNIDKTLLSWRAVWKNFLPYNFNMLDYFDHSLRDGYVVNTPDTLSTKYMDENYENGFTTMACVINSDVYSGTGKHWMALFVDMRGCKPMGSVKATIEFFNSSGNSPVGEWSMWMAKTKEQLMSINIDSDIIVTTRRKQQRSKTECGVYSLYYIWCRLNNVPWTYFRDYPVPDQLMFEFRQHLFDGAITMTSNKFSWEEYITKVKVLWEN